jgi:hypothetical protein
VAAISVFDSPIRREPEKNKSGILTDVLFADILIGEQRDLGERETGEYLAVYEALEGRPKDGGRDALAGDVGDDNIEGAVVA